MHPLLLYLRKHGLTQAEFASRIPVAANTVNGWINREITPRPRHMRRILAETNGEVGPDAFFGLRSAAA